MHAGQSLSPGEPLAAHNARAELASTVRAGEHIAALLPAAGAEYRTLSDEVLDQLDRMPPEAPSMVHGDAKSDNVVAHADRICLLDLDRCGSADPALDLGKLLADLGWWSRELAVDARPLFAALVAGYGACDPARWKRARLLAVLFSLKLAARRHPVHGVGWEVLVRDHLAEASARLTAERTR
jgi:Ser/Thr protein kinase RdoA (MazF antagonist)